MAKTNKRYELEFKKQMVRLILEEGRTIASVNKEYNLGEGTVRSWIRQFEIRQWKVFTGHLRQNLYDRTVLRQTWN